MKSNKKSKLGLWRERAKMEDLPCAWCGRVGYMSLDHIIPVNFLVMLGIQTETHNDEWNFQYLCRACNGLKAGRFDPTHPNSWENLDKYIQIAKDYYSK